jgi:diguanylate cyclase (GGDEF)-like protein
MTESQGATSSIEAGAAIDPTARSMLHATRTDRPAAPWRRSNDVAHALIDRALAALAGKPQQFDEFEGYARHMTARAWIGFSVACVIINLSFWGFDPLIFRGESDKLRLFTVWRAVFLGTAVVGGMAMRRLANHRASPYSTALVILFGFSAFSYGLFGFLGGADRPWLHTGMMFPLATMLFVVPVLTRLALSLGTALMVLLASFAPHPAYLLQPFVLNLIAMTFGIALLGTMMGHAFYVLLLRNFTQRRELTRLAYTDSLTGVANRARFLTLAEREVARALRYGRPLALLVLDVDHFKRINDSFGHLAGDTALKDLGRALAGSVRASDVVGRLGGEEFAVVLPETGSAAARELAERLRLSAHAVDVPSENGRSGLSVTVGGTQLVSGAEGLKELLIRADRALYQGKRDGRDRVVIG